MQGFAFGLLSLLTLTSLVFDQPTGIDFERQFLERNGDIFGQCGRGWSFSSLMFEPEGLVFECYPPPPAGQTDRWNRCIPLELRCDGKRHCANGKDEKDCEAPESAACPFMYIPCQRGQCINNRVFTQFFESVGDAMSYCDEQNRNYIVHVLRKHNETQMRYTLEEGPTSETCEGMWCEPDQYCVSQYSICDGYDSCSDGSDEDASVCTPDRPCEGVRCVRRWSSNNNTHCIPAHEVCNNNEDCENGEDEEVQLCLSRNCSEPDAFKCPDTGRCVSSYGICNGYENCEDGSDETEKLCEEQKKEALMQCDLSRMTGKSVFDIQVWDTHRNECQQAYSYCQPEKLKQSSDEEEMLISQRKKRVCAQASCLVPQTVFRCSGGDSGVDFCIPESSVCNGFVDCLGGEDEDPDMCTPDRKCFRGQVACGDGQCVREVQMCDGVVNCVNGFDENEEMCGKPSECSQFASSCGDGQCIWKRSVCDHITDCLNGRDEQDDFCRSVVCGSLYVNCNQSTTWGGKCAPKVSLCTRNFESMCMDHVDEDMCEVRKNVCPYGEVPCGDGQCVEEEYICSGTEVQCQNGNFTSDTFCDNRKCPPDQFSCGNGQCISREKVCDGLTDCYRTQRDESFDLCGYPTSTSTTTPSPPQGSVDNVAASCQDLVTYCHHLSTLRVCERHQTFSREYSAKTCGLCSPTPSDVRSGSVNYVINHYYNCKL